MSVQQLTDLIQDEEKLEIFDRLVEQFTALMYSKQVQDEELKRINEELKKIGLKPAELAKVVKYKREQDLLMNELESLNIINDHLIDR